MALGCVMLVDDNAALREILSLYLLDAGYEVLEAQDGEKALQLVRSQKVELTILDIMLPGGDELSVLHALRTFSQMPILLISSLPESEVIWETCGANGFMRKPLRPKELVSRVKALFESLP
jgi:two-component system, OmpR family, response regulator